MSNHEQEEAARKAFADKLREDPLFGGQPARPVAPAPAAPAAPEYSYKLVNAIFDVETARLREAEQRRLTAEEQRLAAEEQRAATETEKQRTIEDEFFDNF